MFTKKDYEFHMTCFELPRRKMLMNWEAFERTSFDLKIVKFYSYQVKSKKFEEKKSWFNYLWCVQMRKGAQHTRVTPVGV